MLMRTKDGKTVRRAVKHAVKVDPVMPGSDRKDRISIKG